MSFLQTCNKTYNKEYIPKYRNFPFELDHFQKYACEGIDNNHNVFLSVATGSGKTVPAQYAISKAISENKNVIYISPIKALSNQKYKDFSTEYVDIGIMTGDNKINPNAQLIIMTAEIFRNALYRSKYNTTLPDSYQFNPDLVKYVILDEVHYINDKDRGRVWEEILMLLPKDVHLTMLSATIDSPEVLASWIGNYQKKITKLITVVKRPIPLKYYLQKFDEKKLIMDDKFIDNSFTLINESDKLKFKNKIHKITKYKNIFWINHSIKQLELEEKLPSIFFVLSKKQINSYVNEITGDFLSFEEICQVKKIWKDNLFKFKKDYSHSKQYEELYNLVIRGIAYHHSGIIPILKEIVEILYSKKLIKVLLATETFAVGVNMPTKTVVFTGLHKFDNYGRRLLRTEEFLQMAGRAGRRGLDTFGEIIILPINIPTEKEFKKIILGKNISLSSKLQLDYNWILRNIYMFNLINKDSTDLDVDDKDKLIEFLINNAKQSFLEKNSPEDIKKMNIELEILNKELNIFNEHLDKEFIQEYITLKNNLDSKCSQKKRKEYSRKIKEFENHKNFTKLTKFLNIQNNIKKLENNIGFQKHKLYKQFNIMISYFTKEKFIQNNILTLLGLATKEINEINPLVISYLTFNNYLDDITFPQLVGFISIFLETKSKTISFSDLDISDKEYDLLNVANETSNYYLDKELELSKSLPYVFVHDYDLTLDNYKACYDWADGKTWIEIKSYYGGFEGNFCKIILRIHNILRELITIFDILKKDNLVKIINLKQDSLIREIVQTESLYLV